MVKRLLFVNLVLRFTPEVMSFLFVSRFDTDPRGLWWGPPDNPRDTGQNLETPSK